MQKFTFLGKSDIMTGNSTIQIFKRVKMNRAVYNIKSQTFSSKEDAALKNVPMIQLIERIKDSNWLKHAVTDILNQSFLPYQLQ